MSIVDSILNTVGVLLWFHWCSLRFDPLAGSTPRTLAGTLRRAEARKVSNWQTLALLVSLLVLRAWIYWQIGPAVKWTARVDVSMIVLAFRSDYFLLALLYSFLSLLRVLTVIYFWLIALAVINWTLDGDPVQRMVRLHLGRLARFPRWILAILPCLVVAFAWIALHPLFVKAGLVGQLKSFGQLVQQGILVGASVYFSLKFLIPAILLVYLLITYVHLGHSPFWEFINNTARNILRPFRAVPHKLGRIDFLPLITTVGVLLLLDALPNYLQHRFPDLRRWLWPL